VFGSARASAEVMYPGQFEAQVSDGGGACFRTAGQI
jgi:hypothetical protein